MSFKTSMLIDNSSDPTGMGMYSKTGKYTSSLYSVLKKKDEILFNKPKFLKVSLFPTFDVDLNKIMDDQQSFDDSFDNDKNEVQVYKKQNLRQIAD